jgi:hypothetical protein
MSPGVSFLCEKVQAWLTGAKQCPCIVSGGGSEEKPVWSDARHYKSGGKGVMWPHERPGNWDQLFRNRRYLTTGL